MKFIADVIFLKLFPTLHTAVNCHNHFCSLILLFCFFFWLNESSIPFWQCEWFCDTLTAHSVFLHQQGCNLCPHFFKLFIPWIKKLKWYCEKRGTLTGLASVSIVFSSFSYSCLRRRRKKAIVNRFCWQISPLISLSFVLLPALF